MQGHPQVLDLLNAVLRKELTGINQYMVHAKMCEHWGYNALARVSRDDAMEEMKHADLVIDRLLFLEGTPNMSGYDRIMIGNTVRQQLEHDLALEMAALQVLNSGVKLCMELGDTGSRELLEHIIIDEEKHVDWLEAQLHKIRELGYETYLAQQIYEKG
jgi:bacterioferritin